MEKITNIEYKKADDESTRQEKNRILVEREILCLFSYPMAKLQEKEIVSYDDFENLTYSDEQLKINHAHDLKEDIKEIENARLELVGLYEYEEDEEKTREIEGQERIIEERTEKINEYIQNIKDRGEDAQEIYEYWIVTEWFYNKLKELGEPVTDWENLYIWGRTCTGQAIALDYTIDNIRKTLN